MRSTMQDVPLSISMVYRYATRWFGDCEVVTATEDGKNRRTSYAEMGKRVARLASALRELGIEGDDRVGTFMWNNQEHVEAYLAIPSMGAVLHTLNIRLFPEQVVYIANHAEDKVVIVDASLVPVLAKVLPEMKTVETVLVTGGGDRSALESSGKRILDYEETLAAASDSFDWPEIDERDAAAMCYTSGTTGNPKGVVYSHRSTYLHSAAVCTTNAFGVSSKDRVLPIVPMFHANAWGLIYAALMGGASLVLPDRFMQAEPMVNLIESERPTVSGAVPTVWNDILLFMRKHPDRDLSSLRFIGCGGSAVPKSLMQAFEEEFGVYIQQAWGMTETSPVASNGTPPFGVTGDAVWDYRGTQGRLLCGVEGRLTDDEGNEVPTDGKAVGELEVRGPWVTGAYYKDDDPEKFRDGWLRTGDVGIIDERGYITLTDRSKDVIKSGGEWISSVELETTLAAHPSVVEAAVVAVPDDKWSERPLACVVVAEGKSVTADELRDFLSDKVARWWLPERWSFIEEVPRTSVGKFDKKVLRKAYAEGELDVEELEAAAKPGS